MLNCRRVSASLAPIERKPRLPQLQGVQGRCCSCLPLALGNSEDEVRSAFPTGKQNEKNLLRFQIYDLRPVQFYNPNSITSHFKFYPCFSFCLRSIGVKKAPGLPSKSFSGKFWLARRWKNGFDFHWQIISGCGALVKKKHKLGYNFSSLGTRYGVSTDN